MLSMATESLDVLAAARLAGFPGFLRANGFAVGGGDALPVLQTAQRVGVLDPHLLRWSLQALLCGRCDEWQRFDELFDAWFLPANRWQRPEKRDVDGGALGAGRTAAHTDDAVNDDDVRPRRAASREEVLSSTDFRALTERKTASPSFSGRLRSRITRSNRSDPISTSADSPSCVQSTA